MKVFSKDKFIEVEGYEKYLKCKDWVDECNNQRVVSGEINGYLSDKAWEIEK